MGGGINKSCDLQVMRSSSAAKKNARGSSFLEPSVKSGNTFALASLIKDTKYASDGKLLHNYLLQHGQLHITFLRNCLIEMYGNCGTVADARSVFNNTQSPNLYSYNLMLRSYALNGNVDDAQELFNRTPNPDAYTWNLLLKAFIKHGTLHDARKLFEHMPFRSIVSWTAMIAALAHAGRCQEALEIFYRMYTERFTADKVTFLRALDACSSYVALIQGQEIHAAIVECGLGEDCVVGTSLISMYGKCESLAHARIVFFRTKKKDIVCWTALITACAQNEQYEEALQVFFKMQNEGLIPDTYTYIGILDACSGLLLLDEGRQIHAAVIEGGPEKHFMMGTALVNFYGKCKSLQDARNVFDGLIHRDVVSWNAMISALVESDCNKDALHLFWQMHLQAITADNISYLCTLNACNNLDALEEGQEIHMAMAEYEVVGDVMLTNSLINLYGKSGNLCDANYLFYGRAHWDLVSWNIMISAYVSNGLAKESLILLHNMQQAGIKADSVTFTYAVDACSLLSDLRKGQETHANLVESGFHEDPMICSALLKMYGKCNSTQDAVYILENMKEVDIVSWTALIGAYVENGCGEAALSVFHRMQLKGIQPDDTAYVCALGGCASLAALEKGEEIHYAVQERGREKASMVGNALIHMYGSCGDIKKAEAVFVNIPEPNLATWNAVIAAFAHNGQGEEALGYYSQMLNKGVEPDGINFVSILTACSHAGWIDTGKHHFARMRSEFKVLHVKEHYVCLIDLLGRAGQLEEAEWILHHLSVQKADTAWLSLLGACRIHNDHERALLAAEKLFELDHDNSAPLLMLAGMFAAS